MNSKTTNTFILEASASLCRSAQMPMSTGFHLGAIRVGGLTTSLLSATLILLDREAELKERPLKQTARRQHNTVDGQHRLLLNI